MSESTDVNAEEITPELFDGEQEAPKAESSPAEETESNEEVENTPEVEEKDEAEDKTEDEEPATEDEAEEPVEETKPLAKAEQRKVQLNTEIRDLVSQRNALRAEIEKVNAEVYQPATEEELVDQGLSATDAKVEALRQQFEVSKYNESVADAQLSLASESQQVLDRYPIFNPDSESFNQELAEEAAILLEANLIKDQNTGQIIGSNISPLKLYSTLAKAANISAAQGQVKGQKAAEKMLTNTDTPSSASKPKKKADPLMEIWSEDL